MDNKSCIEILETLKMSACVTERIALNQAIESIKKLHKLRKWIKENERNENQK